MEVFNEFTKTCDRYLLAPWKELIKDGFTPTYMVLQDGAIPMESIPFRFPGASRGHISVGMDGRINGVTFYETAGYVYDQAIKDHDFIGMSIFDKGVTLSE